jgi:SAM-dependent methyltransferase
VTFDVAGEAYARFMGRWSEPLGAELVAAAGIRAGQRALDVGCGPGALTARLVHLLGPGAVSAADPSPPFVAATRERLPGVDVREAVAEALPFADDTFDAALAQLVVSFMSDPVGGLREMGRVTRPGGTVAACVWDFDEGGPLTLFWRAAHDVDPAAPGEAGRPGTRAGQLETLAAAAGLGSVRPSVLGVERTFPTFADWWDPFLLGVGPAGDYVAGLDDATRAAVAERCRALLPPEPFTLRATAWCVTAIA